MSAIPIPMPKAVEKALLAWAETLLTQAGAVVSWPEEGAGVAFVTPMAFFRERGGCGAEVTLGAFYSRLRSPACPKCPRRLSPTGRLMEFAPTPEVVRFLTAAPHPRRAA